jgi:general secretion pathway protein K
MSPELNYEIADGSIVLLIEDQERYLNVNQWTAGLQLTAAADASLFSAQMGLDPLWLDELVDFTDLDQEPQALGAEDYYYLGLEQPYRTSSQRLVHPSELRLLKSMTPEAFARLKTSLVALPAGALPMNVNTMPASSIRLLAPELTMEAAESVVLTRSQQEGFESVQAFLALPEFAGLDIAKFPLGVQSSFFKVRIRVAFLDQVFFLSSLLYREPATGQVTLLHRALNEPFVMPEVPRDEDDV